VERAGRNIGMGRAGASRLPLGGGAATIDSFLANSEWQIWGRALGSTQSTDAAVPINAQTNSPGLPNAPMIALPNFFPRAGVVTALAMVLTDDAAGANDLCWLGLTRAAVVGNGLYPLATEVSFTVRGQGLAPPRLRGSAITMGVAVQEVLFALYQSPRSSGLGGTQILGLDKRFLTPLLSAANGFLVGKSIGDGLNAVGTGGEDLAGIIGYEDSWQARALPPFTEPLYTVGRNFPAAAPYCLATQRVGATLTGFERPPMLLYKFVAA
jgi:hypothetical protein